MHNKLEEIITKTKADINYRKQQTSLDQLRNNIQTTSVKSLSGSMRNPKKGSLAIIAEIKLASPTQPHLGSKEDILNRAKKYQQAEADAISFVTEKHFFNGDASFIKEIKQNVSLPILQKDFIIDSYQVYESKKEGADALLLIARILSEEELISLVNLIKEVGIEPIVEINNENDLKKALLTTTEIIAVNARDLDTFEINIDKACELIKLIPNHLVKLGFSGITEKKDAEKYKQAGANGILIGTSLMKSLDISGFLKKVRR